MRNFCHSHTARPHCCQGMDAIAAVMSIENYPLNIAPNIDQQRVQRVANEMLQFHMLKTKFEVSSMLSGP